jgi:hypothetical protein
MDGVELETEKRAAWGDKRDVAGDVGLSVHERILAPNKRLIAARTP